MVSGWYKVLAAGHPGPWSEDGKEGMLFLSPDQDPGGGSGGRNSSADGSPAKCTGQRVGVQECQHLGENTVRVCFQNGGTKAVKGCQYLALAAHSER